MPSILKLFGVLCIITAGVIILAAILYYAIRAVMALFALVGIITHQMSGDSDNED